MLDSVALIRADKLLFEFTGSSMPNFDCTAKLRWDRQEAPEIILFISHRWRTPENPDPDGSTFRVVRDLLSAIDKMARGLDPGCLETVPDFCAPYMIQACIVLYRLFDSKFEGDTSLSDIAIFFDYSCLPQGSDLAATDLRLRGLACFPSFIPGDKVTLLAIRDQNDDYDKRAWCMAESLLALEHTDSRSWRQRFPIRIDVDPKRTVVRYPQLRDSIAKWVSDTEGKVQISESNFEDWMALMEICADWFREERTEASNYLHHSGVSSELSFQLFLNTMLQISELGNGKVDLTKAVIFGAKSVDLSCSLEADLVPAGLLILAGLRWEKLNRVNLDSEEVDVWKAAFLRYCSKQKLMANVTLNIAKEDGKLLMPSIDFVD